MKGGYDVDAVPGGAVMKDLLDFLGCPLRNFPANAVPEAEIRCRYDDCINGQGVGAVGVCRDGDPRQADCAGSVQRGDRAFRAQPGQRVEECGHAWRIASGRKKESPDSLRRAGAFYVLAYPGRCIVTSTAAT